MSNYNSDYDIRLATLGALGGNTTKKYDSVYEIDLEILALTEAGSGADIQVVDSLPLASDNSAKILRLSTDNKIYVAVNVDGSMVWEPMNAGINIDNYYTMAEVDEKINTITNTENSDLEEKSTIDFTFVDELPASGDENQCVIIQGENQDTLYKYVSGAWVEQTPDANSLYFDTEGNQLYSYVSTEHQFAPISTVDTIIVSGNLNSNAALKQIKTAGNYNVLQHLTNATRGSYLKNWVLTVQAVDYDEYDTGDSVYQKLENNVTIYKRTWSGSRQTNDGWTVFSTYYEGLVKDTATSKYYTWSSNKLNTLFSEKQDALTAGDNITISANTISANDTIEEVSALPEASENKDKLFRLDNGEKDVYAAKLLSSETITTNRLPDAQQIDKAYLYQDSTYQYHYLGVWKLIASDGEIDGYLWEGPIWEGEDTPDGYVFTKDNAENVNDSTEYVASWELDDITVDSTSRTMTTTSDMATVESYSATLDDYPLYPIPATYNAPEANQIGNAYLTDAANVETGFYTGEQISFEYDGEQVTGYKWDYNSEHACFVSDKPASQIYFYYDENNDVYYTDAKIWIVDLVQHSSFELAILTDLYIPQLNAPDSEQVDNAYIDTAVFSDEHCIYKGVETTITVDNTDITVYTWEDEDNNLTCYSTKRANEIYNTYNDSDSVKFYTDDGGIYDINFNDETLISISTVKYQRTVVSEEWDWEKVATEQYVDDAIDNIDIPEYSAGQGISIDSANTISCTVNPITEVSSLPDAEENKDKFVRLQSDNKVYTSVVTSSSLTNRLPDAQQIDKAYLYTDDGYSIYYYKGYYRIVCTDGELDGYGWYNTSDEFWYMIFTEDDAANTNGDTLFFSLNNEELSAVLDVINRTITFNDMTLADLIEWIGVNPALSDADIIPIPAIYNAPESAQIGNATFMHNSNHLGTGYNGAEVEYNGEIWYKWETGADRYYYISSKKASETYGNFESYWISDVKLVFCDSISGTFAEVDASEISDIIIPKLNAPDSEQVDNAYITYPTLPDDHYTYNGVRTFNCTDGTLNLYEWEKNDYRLFTEISASDLYGEHAYEISEESITDYYTVDWTTYDIEATVAQLQTLLHNASWGEWNYTTVKYQRTAYNYEWKSVVTEDELSTISTELSTKQDILTAGQNISIEDNTVSALGYKYNGKNFVEIPLYRLEAITDFPYPLAQIGLDDLQLTGAAGATTYTYGGTSAAIMPQMAPMMTQFGILLKTATSDIVAVVSIDTANTSITMASTLDANNALSGDVVTNLYIPENVTISGSANTTTYTYVSDDTPSFQVGDYVSFGDYPLVKVTAKDGSNHTVTFNQTLDANNAVSNAKFNYLERENNTVGGAFSHAEGTNTAASGRASHAEGEDTIAMFENDHAEGYGTTASGHMSHAEGYITTASGGTSHAEGFRTIAAGLVSHSEGDRTLASGSTSHAEGEDTEAYGASSHSEGQNTQTQNSSEHAEGRYNLSHKAGNTYGDSGNTQHSVGIGADANTRKNAVEVMQNGDMYVLGVGGYVGTNTKVQDNTIQTLQAYIASLEARIAALENPNS